MATTHLNQGAWQGLGVFVGLNQGAWQGGWMPAPAAPVLATPADGATDELVDITFTWNASATADSYRFQLSELMDFSVLIEDEAGLLVTQHTVTGLNANTTYYWRVNATNAGGTSAWSATWSFTTVAEEVGILESKIIVAISLGI